MGETMDIKQLKERVLRAIDDDKEMILKVGGKIYNDPELGYKEFKSTEVVANFLDELGLDVEKNIAVTGCKSMIKGGKSGPNIAILAELDAIQCSSHKDASREGVVHACGHNIQIAGMLGAALGL